MLAGVLHVFDEVLSDGDRLLTTGEVAAKFRVNPKTVTRWSSAGQLRSVRTPGGHRRFRESVVEAFLADAVAAELLAGINPL